MNRIIAALALASALAACDGASLSNSNADGIGTGAQPLIAEPPDAGNGGGDPADPEPDGDPDNLYASELDGVSDDLQADGMAYDPATGELVFNNLPFDSEKLTGGENVYVNNAPVTAALAGTGSGFTAYANAAGPRPASQYYAVFRRSDDLYSQVGAVGTDRYLSFGFGGAAAQRLSGKGELPQDNDSYVFNGEYAAVRTVVNETTGTRIEYVTGTSRIEVDILDPDVTGAVEGLILNRRFFDANGIEIPELADADYLTLRTADINFDNWTISASGASSVLDGEEGMTGQWGGLFAGPNGEEVAGIVIVEGDGPVGIDPGTGEYVTKPVRETGGFIAKRPVP